VTSTLTYGCSASRGPTQHEKGETVPDEIELVRLFRDDIPGPSSDAWLRARAAVAAAGADEMTGRQPQRNRFRPRPATAARLAITGAVAGLAAVLGLAASGVFSPASPPGIGTIRTDAFTLIRNANGTDSLTLNAQVISEPGTLQKDLAQYGIPAIVTAGSFCSSNPTPDGFAQVVTINPPPGDAGWNQHHGRLPTITIDPAAIPAGAELSFGIFQLATGPSPLTAITLTDASSYTCTSTTPVTLPPGGALLHIPARS
jgi:hypothetical protein